MKLNLEMAKVINRATMRCAVILGLFTIVGCGGRVVMPTKQADLVIPNDLAKAYEVKDITTPSTAPVEDPAKKVAKKKKQKKEKPVAPPSIQGALGPSSKLTKFAIPNRRTFAIDPIWVGEKVRFDVSWLNTKAGELVLEVKPFKEINGRKVYHIRGSAKTSDLFSLIYKAEDWAESYVDYEGWFPYKFVLHGDETRHIRDHLELFDHGAKKQYVHIYDNRILKNEIHEDKGIKDLNPFAQDSVSALFYTRTFDLKDGAEFRFPMTTNGSQWETVLNVVGREEVRTRMGYLKAIKMKVETRLNGILQQQGDAFVWFTDDDRKFPIKFGAKVKIGWVEGIIKEITPGEKPEGVQNATSVLPPPPTDANKSSGVEKKNFRERKWFKQLLDTVNETVKGNKKD